MARISRRTPKKQSAKKGRKPARSPAKAGKAPVRQGRKPASRGKAPARRATKAKRPARRSHADEVRRMVARPRPGEEHKPEAAAEHDHQDPRLAGVPGIGAEGDKVQAENYGQHKNRAVARFDKPVNWFRRAPKSPQ